MCDTLNNARWHDRDVFCNQLRIEAIVLGEDTAGTGELTKFARIDASDGQANCEQTSIGRGGCGLPIETGAMA